jgi:protoheme IX farnesyltransferase
LLIYTTKAYLELIKPRIVLLLVFTSLVSYIIASKKLGYDLFEPTLFISILAITTGTAGCSAVTGFIDRDIDKKMKRTMNRPLPTNRIRPARSALYFGITLIIIGSALSLLINVQAYIIGMLGVLDNLIIYSKWLKRRNPINIILGGLSGGTPILFGWVSATKGEISLLPILIAATVIVWIPSHIWNLALYFKADYVSAGVPMLPVVVEEKKAIRCIASTVPILFLITVFIGVVGGFGIVYWSLAVPFGVMFFVGNLYTLYRPRAKNLWLMYKMSSPYLAVIFLGLMIDILL